MFGVYVLAMAVDWNKRVGDAQYVSVEHVDIEVLQGRDPADHMMLSWLIEKQNENETDVAVMISFPISMNPHDALLAFNKFIRTNTDINTNPPNEPNLN